MKFVGIDIASEKHDCCILDESRHVVTAFSFSNDRDGFALLQTSISRLNDTNIKIGLESTGIYGDNLVAFLRRNGYETCTFNPLLIKKSIQGTTLRKTKTDKSDAKFIATYLARELSEPDPTPSYHISELKSLSRIRFSMVQDRAKSKTQLKRILTVVFPEYRRLFSDVFCKSSLAVLKKYQSAAALANAKPAALAAILQKASRKRLGLDKAHQMIALPKNSVGRPSNALCIQLRYCIADIEAKTGFIDELEREIKAIMSQLNSPITTIPGIGFILGASILAEIGDISRFDSSAKLLSFAGLEPSIYQSGKLNASTGTMVKRGSAYLRCALMLAARSVSTHDPIFAACLSKKQQQGKHYNVACSHVAKKLVRTIFAILKKIHPIRPFILILPLDLHIVGL